MSPPEPGAHQVKSNLLCHQAEPGPTRKEAGCLMLKAQTLRLSPVLACDIFPLPCRSMLRADFSPLTLGCG